MNSSQRSPRRGPAFKVRQSDELFEPAQPKSSGSTGTPVDVLPFEEYLRTTPAAPLSEVTKALLWAAGLAVAILFAAAIWKINQKKSTTGTAVSAFHEVNQKALATGNLLFPLNSQPIHDTDI